MKQQMMDIFKVQRRKQKLSSILGPMSGHGERQSIITGYMFYQKIILLAQLWCYEQLVGETGREREKRERE